MRSCMFICILSVIDQKISNESKISINLLFFSSARPFIYSKNKNGFQSEYS